MRHMKTVGGGLGVAVMVWCGGLGAEPRVVPGEVALLPADDTCNASLTDDMQLGDVTTTLTEPCRQVEVAPGVFVQERPGDVELTLC